MCISLFCQGIIQFFCVFPFIIIHTLLAHEIYVTHFAIYTEQHLIYGIAIAQQKTNSLKIFFISNNVNFQMSESYVFSFHTFNRDPLPYKVVNDFEHFICILWFSFFCHFLNRIWFLWYHICSQSVWPKCAFFH